MVEAMRDYISACKFPLGRIADKPVPRLILGHLPFIGESYQGPERDREYRARFSRVENIVKILRIAVEGYGLTVMAAGLMPSNIMVELLFKAIREASRVTKTEIALIPCIQIPLRIDGKPVDPYRRWLTYYETERNITDEEILLERYLQDPILQCRSGWKLRFQHTLRYSKPYEEDEIEKLQVDYESLGREVNKLQGFNVLFAELGSETDFLALTGRLDLLGELIEHLRDVYGYDVLLGIHHAGTSIPRLEGSKLDFEGYITPVNRLGVMMFPTMDLALEAVKSSSKPVIAIKPLAGGRIKPKQALEYIYRELGVEFSMIGVGSEGEAREDFSTALKILS